MHWILLACTQATVSVVPGTDATTTDPDSATPVEQVGSVEEDPVDDNGDTVFRGDLIHDYELTIMEPAMQELRLDPRSYVTATFSDGQALYEVGVRLKGNTSYTWFDEKPALIVDFDFSVPEQRYHGVPSFYLQNMTWDPSMIHEHLAYWAFRQAEVPSSRTSYCRLTINQEPYGLYLVLEKQNSLFRKQWWEDRSGSVYEAGSFNHPCDLNDGSTADPCTCYEIDRVGEDAFEDLQAVCLAARSTAVDWRDQLEAYVDWPVFLRAMATEMVVGHYDNYGWNINNYRLYHEPTKGLWYWTPWSTDLAFGWYPWMNGAHCGTYANTPDEYQGGFLIKRCWSDTDCTDELLATLAEQVDAFEAWNAGEELERLVTMIQDELIDDPRSRYTNEEALSEIECVRTYIAERPANLRDWLDRH
jgi:spore coat protein CotH